MEQSEQDPAKMTKFYEAVKQEQAVRKVPRTQELTNVQFEKKSSVEHPSTDLLRRDYEEYSLKPSWIGSSTSNSNGVSSPIPPPPPQSQIETLPTTTIQIGLASVTRDLKEWISSDPEFWTACEKYIDERNLSALGILTAFKFKNNAGTIKRDRRMLWIVRDGGEVEAELRKRLWRGLEDIKGLKVKVKNMQKLGSGAMEAAEKLGDRVRYFKQLQGNAEAMRKAMALVVRNIVEGDVGADGKL